MLPDVHLHHIPHWRYQGEGEETIAGILARKGSEVFGTIRKQADADRLWSEYGTAFTSKMK